MADSVDPKTLPRDERIKLFQKEYNDLAHKYNLDFTCLLVPTKHSIEAQIAYRDLSQPDDANAPSGRVIN